MVGVIAFAFVSLLCLILAAREWSQSRAPAGENAPDTSLGWSGGVVLLLVSLALLGGLWVMADVLGWDRDRTLWLGFAGYLALMTLVRPTWFWENYRARMLRDLVGDEATAVLYLLFAAVMVWVGLYSGWSFGRQ